MNTKLLRRIQKQILKEPRQVQMEKWFKYDKEEVPNCGTAACIGGWAIALSRKVSPRKAHLKFQNSWAAENEAGKLLKLPDGDERSRLFGLSFWPTELRDAYDNATTPLQVAKAVIRRINHFIKTKGAE